MDDAFGRQAIAFERCFNFRDLGGYPTAGGGRVAKGRLFRSDSLHRLQADDLARLGSLGIRTVVDLRADRELVADGECPVPDVGVHRCPLDDTLGGLGDVPLHLAYLRTVEADAASVAAAVSALAGEQPAVFHCTSGKDRTGMVAAMVLDLLGVPDEVIGQDYLLTTGSRAARDAYLQAHEPERAAFFASLPPSVLVMEAAIIEGFLHELRSRHGSVRDFLEGAGTKPEEIDVLMSSLVEPAQRS